MTEDPVARMKSSRVRELYEYWNAKRGDRAMPGREDIDPAEIKGLLPYVLLTDLHHDPLRVFFRLVGTAVAQAAGRDITGRWLHEIPLDGGLDLWLQNYERLVRERRPVCGRTRASVRAGDERVFEWILLPLSSDGEGVDKTLELEDWEALRRMSPDQIDHATWSIEVFK
jgi:hypothetical protein